MLSQTELEAYATFKKADFVSRAQHNDLKLRLSAEGNQQTLIWAAEKYIAWVCPECGEEGLYRWHFLGELKHAKCGAAWHVDTGTYAKEQFRAVFRAGGNFGGQMASDPNGRTNNGAGIAGFIMGAIFRLPFAVLMIPVQMIIVTSKKNRRAEDSSAR